MNQHSLTKATEKELAQLDSLLEKYGTKKNVPKGKQIIIQGEKSDFFFFVEKEGFKSYISRGDRDYILGFSFAQYIDCCPFFYFLKMFIRIYSKINMLTCSLLHCGVTGDA
jgi:hypothetical protein